MKIKNVRSPKQPGQRYLNKMQKYENKGNENSIVIEFGKQYFIIDQKYEKKCRKILKKYKKTLKGKNTSIFALSSVVAIAAIAWILLDQNPNLHIPFTIKEEKDFDEKEIELTAEEIEDIMKPSARSRFVKEIVDSEAVLDEIEQEKVELEPSEVEAIQKELWQRVYDTYIKKYCGYFHFDYNKVIELARNMTNNYEDFSNIITEEDCDVTNKEAVSMYFVYLLYEDLNKGKNEKSKLPINEEELELIKEEIVLTDEITTTYYDDLNTFYLHGGLKYSKFVEKYCDMLKIDDKVLALSISFEEISEDGSRRSREDNNFGGMRIGGVWLTFPTPEAGIICFCVMIKNSYNKSVEDIYEMSYKYIGKDDNQEAERRQWSEDVKSFYNKIQENYDFYFSNESDPDFNNETNDNVPQLIRTRDKAV